MGMTGDLFDGYRAARPTIGSSRIADSGKGPSLASSQRPTAGHLITGRINH